MEIIFILALGFFLFRIASSRRDNPTFEAPRFEIDHSITDFYAFTKDSFKMVDYKCNKFDYEIPIAI